MNKNAQYTLYSYLLPAIRNNFTVHDVYKMDLHRVDAMCVRCMKIWIKYHCFCPSPKVQNIKYI